MSPSACRPIVPALMALSLAVIACGPSRYRLADPPARQGLGSEDRRCVLPPPGIERQPGHLDPYACAAWTDRSQSAVHPHQWIFFPHFGIGASSRMARECPGCILDVQKGERPTWLALSLRAPPDDTVIARYDGQLVGGLFHGRGRLETTRTAACVGECTDLFVANGRIADTIALEGAWREGFLLVDSSLTGRYVFADGERFEGRLSFDPARGPVPGGRGVWIGADGDTYDGDFVDGVREGVGTLTTADGATYTGAWSRGRRHGQGSATWPDGSTYTGAWERDRRHGQGALRMADGARHEGTFVGDVLEGPGVQHTAAGVRIEAVWAGGKLSDGPASLTWLDGSTFQGVLKDGGPSGLGSAIFPSHGRYAGVWVGGRPHGRGAYTWDDGATVVGELVDGKVEGCALVRSPGTTWVGTFERGVPVRADCDRAPPVWSAADVAPLDALQVDRRALLDAWSAQRRTRASRTAAEQAFPDVHARFADPPPAVADPESTTARVGLAWPPSHQQRFVHPRCIADGTATVTADEVATPFRRAGLLDARLLIDVRPNQTVKLCATFDGPCGAWSGCAAVDTGSASEPAGLVRILLEPAAADPKKKVNPTNGSTTPPEPERPTPGEPPER